LLFYLESKTVLFLHGLFFGLGFKFNCSSREIFGK